MLSGIGSWKTRDVKERNSQSPLTHYREVAAARVRPM